MVFHAPYTNTIASEKHSACFRVLGVRVDAVQIPEVIEQMERWITSGRSGHYISVTNVHVVMETRKNRSFKDVLDEADLAVPDGMPLVWLGRLKGYKLPRRVYGPDLMQEFCGRTCTRGYRHFFYGGFPGVSERLAQELISRFPGLQVAGKYSPPFRTLSRDEDEQVIRMINQARPDVLWVGLGCPKQERWMYEHQHILTAPVMIGVGAAFDFLTERVCQAPLWMREHGLEWAFRLWAEPRRLWRRYLIYNTKFLLSVFLELCHVKRFD